MTTYLSELMNRTKKLGALATTHQGGLAYEITPWDRLRRFLILGSDGGNFYVSERELTRETAQVVIDLLDEDGERVVEQIVAISASGAAVRQQPAIFALALAAAHDVEEVRKAALAAVPQVCRTGTHLFTFAAYSDALRGWGRGLKRAVADWYQAKSASDLIYHAIKYQQRDGWSHADLLRLTHPKAGRPEINAICKWIVDGEYPSESDDQLAAAIRLQAATHRTEAAKLIRDYRLPREIVPTEMLREPDIWAALLDDMPMTAMIRNLGTMSKVELLTVGSDAEKRVLDVLGDAERIRRTRVHPMAILLAQVTYAQGAGYRSNATWTPSRHVVDALDAAFYTAFSNVTPSNRQMLVAIDSSGSMSTVGWASIAGTPLTALQAAGAMALVTLATEPNAEVIAFDTKVYTPSLSSRQRLDDVVKALSVMGGGTNMSLPWQHARERGTPYEGIVVYTDSEDGYGYGRNPQIRRDHASRNPGCREVVVAMTANQYSAVDGPCAMNVVGFDASAPAVISEFIAGAI
jgi:60 kDa SS-A/Ro ribonucleoprotein